MLATSAAGLQPGEFFGSTELIRTGDAFDVKLMQASGREADVQVHAREDAHFVLALSGVYRSTGAKSHCLPTAFCIWPFPKLSVDRGMPAGQLLDNE